MVGVKVGMVGVKVGMVRVGVEKPTLKHHRHLVAVEAPLLLASVGSLASVLPLASLSSLLLLLFLHRKALYVSDTELSEYFHDVRCYIFLSTQGSLFEAILFFFSNGIH